jgi:DNA-binding transcriptional regulator YiaG/predicted nucleotidyltransferase
MKTVRVKLDPNTPSSLAEGRIDKRRLDGTTEHDITVQQHADDMEAMQDTARFARRVRRRLGLTQLEFSQRIDVSLDTIRNWEQGKRRPTGAAKALLKVLDKAPEHAQTSPSKNPIQTDPLTLLGQLLAGVPELEFAVLVGSRAQGTARTQSDWDIALKWYPQVDWLALLGIQETLRRSIADILGVPPEDIDLIDLPRANLAMRAHTAEDGVVLKGEDTLAWARFLTRTWRELEDFYWERDHAA